MSDTRFSEMLTMLSNEYFYSHIEFGEYREQRRILLDKVDQSYNGRKIISNEPPKETITTSAEEIKQVQQLGETDETIKREPSQSQKTEE